MPRTLRNSPRALTRLTGAALSLVVGATTCLPLHVAQAAPAEEAAAEEAAPVEAGGIVALMLFEGSDYLGDLFREKARMGLEEAGYEIVGVKRTASQAQKKVKCKELDAACQAKIAKYLVKNTKKELAFYVYGVAGENGAPSTIVVYDVAKDQVAREINFIFDDADFIASEVLGGAVGQAALNAQVPPAPMSEDEAAVMAALDEPEKTPEEAAAEEKALKEAEEASVLAYNRSMDAGAQTVDLKKDFDDLCREGPREDKELQLPDGTVDVERDLRPACKRGAFWGYWQPRGYAILSLTAIGVAATAGLYGGALAARGTWRDSVDALDSSGLTPNSPDSSAAYGNLASDVAINGQRVRNLAIAGDIALGVTALMGGLLVLTVVQDRKNAREYLQQEKELSITDLQLTPIVAPRAGAYGMGAGFRF